MWLSQKLDKLRGLAAQDVLGQRLQRMRTMFVDIVARQAENKTYLDALKSQTNDLRLLASDMSTRQTENRLLLSDLSTRQSENKTLLDNVKTWLGQIDTSLNYSVYGYAGLAKDASTPAELKFTNLVAFTCGNPSIMYGVSANQNIAFTATTHDIATTASIRERCYMVEVKADGTKRLMAGSIATGSGNAQWPASVSTRTQIAGIRIAVDASAGTIFDATTTTLTASQITATYYNFARRTAIGAVPSDVITAISDAVPTALTDTVPAIVSSTVTAISATTPRTFDEEGDWSY